MDSDSSIHTKTPESGNFEVSKRRENKANIPQENCPFLSAYY